MIEPHAAMLFGDGARVAAEAIIDFVLETRSREAAIMGS